MKRITYYEVVFDDKKGEVKGYRPEYGIASFWIMWSFEILQKLSQACLHASFWFERRMKHKKGKIEKE